MSNQLDKKQAGDIAQPPQSGTTATSTNSGNGSEPLSDAFVAAQVDPGRRKGPGRRVRAPEGAAQLEVRRSSRVATARKESSQPLRAASVVVKAPPGAKPSAGYQYQVLPMVEEVDGSPSGQLGRPKGVHEVRDGSRDIAATRSSPKVGSIGPRGSRKRAATSAAPGSLDRGRNPPHLASAADFSPTHFIEPTSDDHMLPPTTTASPIRLDPKTPSQNVRGKSAHEHNSSPLSHNPLLQRNHQAQTPSHSPGKAHTTTYRTRDPNTAWMLAP